jgi:hypothetical protein
MRQVRWLIVVAILFISMFAHMALAASHCRYCDSTGYGGRCAYSPTGHHSHIPGRSNWEESGSDRSIDHSLVAHVSNQPGPVRAYEGEYYEDTEQSDGASISDVINALSIKKIPWWGWVVIVGIGEVILSKIFK